MYYFMYDIHNEKLYIHDPKCLDLWGRKSFNQWIERIGQREIFSKVSISSWRAFNDYNWKFLTKPHCGCVNEISYISKRIKWYLSFNTYCNNFINFYFYRLNSIEPFILSIWMEWLAFDEIKLIYLRKNQHISHKIFFFWWI